MTEGKPLLGATVLAFASLLRALVQIAILPIIGRILGPHAYGQIALVSPFIFFAMLLGESGLGACIVRATEVTKALKGTIFCFSAAFSLFLIIFFGALAYPMGFWLGEPLFAPLLICMSSILLLASLNIVPAALLLREKRYNLLALSDIISLLGGIAAVTTGIILGWGVWSLVAQQISLWVCKVTVVNVCARSRPFFIFNWLLFLDNFSFGIKLTGSSIVSFIANNVDNVLIGGIMGTETLGYYALASQIVALPASVISGSVYYTVFSATAEAHRRGQISPTFMLNASHAVALVVAPAMVGLAVTADLAIPLILGEKWLPTVPFLICLAPSGLISAMWAPASGVLIALGRSDLILKFTIFNAVTTIAGIVVGISFGSVPVALGVSFAAVLNWCRAYRAALKECSGSLKGALTAVSAPFVAAALMGCVVAALQETLFLTLPLGLRLIMSILTGILVYGAVLATVFRDHIGADIVMVRTLVFSRLRS